MEVHHHSHAHGKKTRQSYFWEFLMLFLAVFCGILAEYQLEHKIEKDRERQYMHSLVEDLQIDTANITNTLNLAHQQMEKLDSLLEMLNNETIGPENIQRLYMLAANSTRVIVMPFENRTSAQLKNSGGMRLVRRKPVADSILAYWRNIEMNDNSAQRLDTYGTERFGVSARLFHNRYYIQNPNDPLSPLIGIREGARLISNDPALLAEYSNRSYSRRNIIKVYARNLLRQQQQAVRLMKLIRDNYHFQ